MHRIERCYILWAQVHLLFPFWSFLYFCWNFTCLVLLLGPQLLTCTHITNVAPKIAFHIFYNAKYKQKSKYVWQAKSSQLSLNAAKFLIDAQELHVIVFHHLSPVQDKLMRKAQNHRLWKKYILMQDAISHSNKLL